MDKAKKDKKDPKEGKDQKKDDKKDDKKEDKKDDKKEEKAEEPEEETHHHHKKKKPVHEEKPEGEGEGNVMEDLSKKQVFKKFSYRGKDIGSLINLSMDELSELLRSRQRRRLRRKMTPKYGKFIKKLMEVKKVTPPGDKPKVIKTHLRDCIVLPSMVQSMISIHNGHGFNPIEVKPEMIGYYLGEFAMSYKRVNHGRPGVGATHSSKFVPIK